MEQKLLIPACPTERLGSNLASRNSCRPRQQDETHAFFPQVRQRRTPVRRKQPVVALHDDVGVNCSVIRTLIRISVVDDLCYEWQRPHLSLAFFETQNRAAASSPPATMIGHDPNDEFAQRSRLREDVEVTSMKNVENAGRVYAHRSWNSGNPWSV